MEFATLRGEPYCRSGSATVAALRLDPARVRLRVRHFSGEPELRPLDILEWQRRSGALAVFNAGQYYGDYSYMGLLAGGGRIISRRPHPTYMAALVAAPRGGGRARVIDLSRERLDADSLGWGEVAQSFMLFDRAGQGARAAQRPGRGPHRGGRGPPRPARGADQRGRLHALGLRRAAAALPLDLSLAMAMDGGPRPRCW